MAVTINGTTGIVTPDIGVDGSTLVIDSANNRVGVLEDSPSNTLTVGDTVQPSYAPTRAGNYIEIARTSGADAGLLINKNTGQWLVGINNGDGANAPLRFEYAAAGSSHPGLGAGTLGMIIKHDGNVGIGTDNPRSALDVYQGTINFGTPGVTNGILNSADGIFINIDSDNNTTNDVLIIGKDRTGTTGGGELLRILENGNVGIGTDNPGVILDVRETKTAGSTQVRVYNTDNSNATTQTAEVSLTPDSRALAGAGIKVFKENADFSTNAGRDISLALNVVSNNSQSEALRIASNGNVQVKTDGANLYGAGTFLISSGSTAGRLDVYGGSTNRGGEINLYGGSNNDGSILFRSGAGANQQPERMRLRGAGSQLLIGTGGDATYNEMTESADHSCVIIGKNAMSNGGLVIRTGSTGTGRIYFADNSGNDPGRNAGAINYYHSSDYMSFSAEGSEQARIGDNYGVQGHTVERYLPVLNEYFDAGSNTHVDVGATFFDRSVAVINSTGDYVQFTFPTCWNHKEVVYAALIYGGQGNVSSQTFTVDGLIYRAHNGQGYTTDSATFQFTIPGVSNGKMYQRNITSVFPALQQGHNNSLRLTFTEDNDGSTLGIMGLQLVERTNPIS